MANVAVLGYGTIGSGAVSVLTTNADLIERRCGEPVNVTRILDLRTFPGDPHEDKIVHDYAIIEEDPDIDVVVECMGGIEPAYTFVKKALQAGRSVATSNKELVAAHGAGLIALAKEHQANFMFEASVGGGIPIIRPLLTSLTADDIESINGILNGTTNYILTKMDEEGSSFDEALKEAQEKGYAELHPEADIEGYDACRKIAILTSLAVGSQVDYEDIQTQGISDITALDIRYAEAMHKKIRLLGSSVKKGGKLFAMVAPFLLDETHPLAGVSDAFNAIYVHGNMVDDTMFYGRGAGSLPTASAVIGDVVDCVRNRGRHLDILWSQEKAVLSDNGSFERRFFVRVSSDVSDEAISNAFGQTQAIVLEGVEEKAFVTETMKEADYRTAAGQIGGVLNMIRLG